MSTTLYADDLVACPHCLTSQGVPAVLYAQEQDECYECQQAFTVQQKDPDIFLVEKSHGD